MTEKEKQIYNAAKNTFNSWSKWKQEAALDFLSPYKEEQETTSLKLCPKCRKITGFNSYFQSYYCTSCGNIFGI